MPLSPGIPPQSASGAVGGTEPVVEPTATAVQAAETTAVEATQESSQPEGQAEAAPVAVEAPDDAATLSAEIALEDEPDPVGAPIDVAFKQIRFTYDTTIARNWTVQYLSNPPASDEPPSFSTGPLRMIFGFSDYPAALRTVEPAIFVYRIDDISAQNEYKVANLLGALLAKGLPPHTYKTLPFLPLIEQEQMILGQSQFIQFQGGSGIRYLTIVGAANEPFLSNSVWYTFQGLTSDNKFYIAAIFPLAADMFPSELGADYSPEAFEARHDEYLLLSKAALNLAPRTAFTPRLSRLDALVESIQIVDEQ